MKKTICAYAATLAFIYLSYLLFALVFAFLFHYANLQPSFYSMATKICSYTVAFISGLGFSLMIDEKKLINAILFSIIFSVINTLLLWHHFDLPAILLKDVTFIAGAILINLIKK